MNVALLDYGTGNLHSLVKAFEQAGASVALETDAGRALAADALVLPGVGAFGAAAAQLGSHGDAVRAALAAGHPCLGICLGMQLLFEASEEGLGGGLAALRGRVRRLLARRVPHMGWNEVMITEDPLFTDMHPFLAYYANSYIAQPADPAEVVAWTHYEHEKFPAAVRRNRTWGVQFHPEKSGRAGQQLIRNFLAAARS